MIQVNQLRKTYKSKAGAVEAVRGIDFEVAEGELVALLGPNGAGKSTTIHMLTTLLRPTSGRATVAGADVATQPVQVRRNLGFIGQGNAAGHHFRVDDELVNQARFYGLDAGRARRKAAELLEILSLQDLARRTVSTLSGGQRRRLDIAMGLVHEPRVLFLDEPSTGMDPHNRANLWEHILALRARLGTTIVLTTHYLDEADNMAERVLIIDHGSIIANDTSARLKQGLGGDSVTLGVPAERADAARVVAAQEADSVEVATDEQGGATLSLRIANAESALPRLLTSLAAAEVPIASVNMQKPSLDDVFLSLTGRSLREEGESA